MGIISSALQLGGAVVGAVSSGIAAKKSAQANEKARQLIQQRRDDNKAWYNAKMSSDYTMRPDAQNVINRQRELLDEQYKNAKATNIVSGGTDASVAMQKAAANDAMAQTMSDIASNAADYKDKVEQQYRAEDAALNQQQAQTYQQQAAQTAQAGSQATNAGLGLIGAGASMTGGISSPSDATARLNSLGIKSPEELANGLAKLKS